MSGQGLFWVGAGVMLIVLIAGGLLAYAAVLDGRDAGRERQAPADARVAIPEEDPGWTWPPHESRAEVRPEDMAAAVAARRSALTAPVPAAARR